VLWQPVRATGPVPLVLYGHGGTGHKADGHALPRIRRFLAHGCAVAAIDGPVHGDRRPPDVDPGDPEALWAAYKGYLDEHDPAAIAADMVADWRAALDHVRDHADIDPDRIGYWGVSMGSRFGLPLLAAEPRITAAVVGLIGPEAGDYLVDIAGDVTVPLRSILNWDDELFAVGGAIALYAALGSTDKRLTIVPGAHGDVPADEYERLTDFLVGSLVGGSSMI
jgi:dienelactone hydrolase